LPTIGNGGGGDGDDDDENADNTDKYLSSVSQLTARFVPLSLYPDVTE
jgi:hypothetical protein